MMLETELGGQALMQLLMSLEIASSSMSCR